MKDLKEQAREYADKLWNTKDDDISGFTIPLSITVNMMEKFAREAVNNALQEAAEKAQMIVHDGHNKTNSYSKHIQMGVNNAQIDKESILSLQIKDNQ